MEKKTSDELIAEVDAADLERAREAIAEAVQNARDEWIPNYLITSALALELQACIVVDQGSDEAAAFLRRLADAIAEPKRAPAYH